LRLRCMLLAPGARIMAMRFVELAVAWRRRGGHGIGMRFIDSP
jgi:hypothetical protein